ncbi:hypothetical protein ACQKL5_11415 [Peribacillus sp. NPDC097675]|uniref:hypothetical protein n=1 Tax=Peribacillus sp. NPDC097675 TaxID=3390618 RepID=UPI003D042C4E
MDVKLSNLTGKAQVSLRHAIAYMKEKITELTGSTSITIMEIASYIQNQPETNRIDKELLGTNYSFYYLKKEDATYHLEMKSTQILQLDVHVKNHDIVSYRSYRDHSKLSSSIKIPETLIPE